MLENEAIADAMDRDAKEASAYERNVNAQLKHQVNCLTVQHSFTVQQFYRDTLVHITMMYGTRWYKYDDVWDKLVQITMM